MTPFQPSVGNAARMSGFEGWRPLASFLLALVAFGGFLAFGAGKADAFDKYSLSGTFGDFAFGVPAKVAVDGSTGNVLVVDSRSGQVQVWGPGGISSALLTSFGSGELSSPYGIAIDQVSHDVYVSDAGNNRVARYSTNGLPTPTYTLDALYAGPPAGSDESAGEVGSFGSAIAVDPINGDLLVADGVNQYVARYTSGGVFVGGFDGADTAGGAFQGLIDIAVASDGTVYVIDTAGGTSRVETFNAAGAAQGALPDAGRLGNARSIAVGQTTGNVFIVEQAGPPILHVYKGGVPVSDVPYPPDYPWTNGQLVAVGVAVDDFGGASSGNVYGLGFATDGSEWSVMAVFGLQRQPDVTIDPPSDLTPTSVRLDGTVGNPANTGQANVAFEYSLDDGASWTAVETVPSSVAGDVVDTTTAVSADVTDLLPNTDYLVRLSATNDNGTHSSDTRSFQTGVLPPGVGGERVTEREATSVTLRGSVDPRGLQTTYRFDYGPTTDYGSRTPAANEAVLGDGQGGHPVLRIIDGLTPGTTYHYRLVAHNSAGDTVGDDRTFTTAEPGAGAGSRVYELVSPADKQGAAVSTLSQGFQMGTSGNTAVFSGGGTVLGGVGSESAPLYPRYVSQRTTSGWSTKAVDPPQKASEQLAFSYTLAVSDDGSKAIVMSQRKLADGAVEGDTNTYLRDVATGEYTTMTTTPSALYFSLQTAFFQDQFVAGTPNFDHVLLIGTGVSFLPGAPPGALYEFTDGQLRLASVLPDGTPTEGSGGTKWDHNPYRMSEDGSRIFFRAGDGAVYVRIDGTTTHPVSASHRASDAGTVQPGHFVAATADGSHAYIYGNDLTDDSEPGIASLYRYSVDGDELDLLTKVAADSDIPRGEVIVHGSAIDGDTLYFWSAEHLAGSPTSAANIYVWRNGALSHVASLDQSVDFGSAWSVYSWRVSPDGRYFAFAANSRLTDYDTSIPQPPKVCREFNDGDPGTTCRQVYRYDADEHTLVCASCRPDGELATGHAIFSETQLDVGTREFPRAVDDSGRVFFDSPEPLVARDVNGARDVYEFDGEGVRLVSTGSGSSARFEGASIDGSSVFFTTQNRLVAADFDNVTDLYVARVGGGIAGQDGQSPSTACSREDCRPGGAGPATSERSPSEAIGDDDGDASNRPRARISRLRASFSGAVLRISLRVSGAGRIRVSGGKVVDVSRKTRKAGVYRLRVRLTGRQRALRRRGHRVRTSVVVSFIPVSGRAVKTTLTRTAR